MLFPVLILLPLILIAMGIFIWGFVSNKQKPLINREFGYLRWAIYLINLLIVGLAVALVVGLIFWLLIWGGATEWIKHIFENFSLEFNSDPATSTPIGLLIEVINTIATLGILICMRAFMKNIIAEEIFVPQNVRLAKLSTFFLVLGSLIRQGNDAASLVILSYYSNGANEVSFEYGFFNMYYLLTAVLVWTLSIILEKATAIAEENEFTI
ncbi:DUF2975 domain-containing protein [Streptococcus moroccensis]|uniref:DUF2975 domain-containing protein n=1 Tax=Streptococcus moroccensis TaxID=1451356 RepID=A0ABT9YTU8_9STRE|nr:DUF2975 domain-containing protein [Streptococcus moroccensis]MDQ0223144.1 hypothetical protein [Streptococcus moroccensis]